MPRFAVNMRVDVVADSATDAEAYVREFMDDVFEPPIVGYSVQTVVDVKSGVGVLLPSKGHSV